MKADWLEVRLNIQAIELDVLEEQLLALGAQAVTLSGDDTNPVLEPGVGETPLWPGLTVIGLFDADASRAAISQALLQLDFIHRPRDIDFSILAGRDWERAWLDRFKPMRFGGNLWIIPTTSGELPADPKAIRVFLDPGLAFGTGTHPTTALCLEWIDGHDFSGKTVIDYGCGSGILGIAAACKGAAAVYAIDHDPQAIKASRENAARNRVSEQVHCALPGVELPAADILLANILAAPLLEKADYLGGLLKAGGELVLSGILEEQQEAIIDAYRPMMARLAGQQKDGWMRIDGIKA